MQRYGDFFPENPKTLDELLEAMARRMAAAQALLNSMTPGQRDQLQQLSDQLLADMDLNWQVNELAQHLRNEFGDLGWDRRYDFGGVDPSTSARPPTCWPNWATSTSSRTCYEARPAPAPSPRPTPRPSAACWATTRRRASSAWPRWPACWRTPA